MLPKRARSRILNARRCMTSHSRPSRGLTNRNKLLVGAPIVLVAGTSILGGAAYYTSQAGSANSLFKKHRNDGPKGKFEEATKDIRISNKPSSDREWSSVLPEMPKWSGITDRLTDVIVPQWANAIPGFVDKLQNELSGGPNTLAEEIWAEAQNPSINPEILRDATVRVSNDLCAEEKTFLSHRKLFTKQALARYLDLAEDDVHPDDVPVIAMCGSGGGLRAMVAGTSSYYSAQRSGLFDCVTYTAGVSGSCWLQTLYFSTITGQKFDRLLQHLKNRLGVHIAFPPDLLKLITSAPTNKFLLSGAYEKFRGVKDADFGLVDVYGIMLGARLLVPRGDLDVDPSNLKLSNQTRYVDKGEHPLPIYTAVRHEIPDEDSVDTAPDEDAHEKAKKEAWFQWFEFTPYELSCEELGAAIPTWAVGREFSNGHDKRAENGMALPEIRVPLLLGVFASAFCATLAHYYKEIRPLVKGLTGFGGLDGLIEERNEDLSKVHPIDPAQIPNFVLGMADQLPKTCPVSVHKATAIQLMDAGMSNNLPIYPLLRPGRDVDIIIAFDASADIKTDNWLRATDGYARQKGIKRWPIGTGFPERQEDTDAGVADDDNTINDVDNASNSQAKTESHKASNDQSRRKTEIQMNEAAQKGEQVAKSTATDLGYCNIWIGSTQERTSDAEPPQSKLVETESDLMEPDAGIAVIYFPFMANPDVQGVDPQTSDYMSTWNFVYTPEQIDKVVELAKTNFDAGEGKTKMCIRAVYERKKKLRLAKVDSEREEKKWWQFGA